MWKLSLRRQIGSVVASGLKTAIVCVLCLLMLTILALAQSSDASQPGRHFILLIDDSGSIKATHRSEMAKSLPGLLFNGIRATAQDGKAMEKFEPGRDRVSVVFFTIYESSRGCQGTQQGKSVRPQDIFLLEESWKPGSREEFSNKLENWLNKSCRGRGQWSPISISQMLVLPYLQKQLPKDAENELHSQTILIVATDGIYNAKSPSHELTEYYKAFPKDKDTDTVKEAHDLFNQVSSLFTTDVPSNWRISGGSLIYLFAELRPQPVPESVLNYQTDSHIQPQAVSSSRLRYALNSQSTGDLQILLRRTNLGYLFKPLWLYQNLQDKNGNEWRIGYNDLPKEAPPLNLTQCQSPQCVRNGDELLGVSLLDVAVEGGLAISPSEPDPGPGKIEFQVGFHYETEVYNHLYVKTAPQTINVEPPDPHAQSAQIPNPLFLPSTRLEKSDLTDQWWSKDDGDDDGVTTQEEAKNRILARRNLYWILLVIAFGIMVGLVLLYLFLTAYQRRFRPKLNWLSAPDVIVDFNRPAASRLLVGTLKVVNDQAVPWFGRLLKNEEQPTRQATVSLDYDFFQTSGLNVAEDNPIGFVNGDKLTTLHEGLERNIQESVSDGKQMHVFLAADAIHDYRTSRAGIKEANFDIDLNARVDWLVPGSNQSGRNGKEPRVDQTLYQLRSIFYQLRSRLAVDRSGSVSLPLKCRLTVKPEEPAKPRVTYEADRQKLYFEKGEDVEIGRFVFKSQALHGFARPFEWGEYTIQSYRDNRPLGGEPIKLAWSRIEVLPGDSVAVPVLLVCDGQDVPNPDPISCEYTFKLNGDFDAKSSPGLHSAVIYRDPKRAEIELMITHPQPQREIFWTEKGLTKQRILLQDGIGAEEREVEAERLVLEPQAIEFDPQNTLPRNLITLKIGNSATSGDGFVAVDLDARIVCDKEAWASIIVADERPIDDLIGVYKADIKDKNIHLKEGDESQTRNLLFDPRLITRIKGARISSDRFSVVIELNIHVRTDEGEEAWRKLTLFIPLGLEQMPGLNWLAIDFGTSAIAAALGTGRDIIPIPLQDIKLDEGISLREYDLNNAEHGNSYLLPSWVICDADTRTQSHAKCKPGFPGYYTESLSLTPGEPDFIGLPALYRQLSEDSDRVIYSLKSWLGKSSENIQLQTKIKYRNDNGQVITSDKIPLERAVESGFAALADAYLLVNDNYRADQIVICHPNIFTQRHKERLREIAYRALAKPDRFGIPLLERIQLISESDAVAYYYCTQRMSMRPPAGTERILVYDFGAGTLDLSLIRVEWKTGTVVYPTYWGVEGRNGVPVAGNYIDEMLARIIDRLLRDQSLPSADSVEYQYPVVSQSPKREKKAEHREAIVRLWGAIREAKHQWDGQSPMNIRVGFIGSGLDVVSVKSGDKKIGNEPLTDVAGLWTDGTNIFLAVPAWMIHNDDRVSEFIRFSTATVIDELLYEANISAQEVDTVVISGRGALWPGLRDQVRNRFPHAYKSWWDGDFDQDDSLTMKDAVVRGAIARQELLLMSDHIRLETQWPPKLGVLINHDQDLILEDDWEKGPIDLSRSPTFRIVQVNLRNPNPREDMRSLRKHFYIDLTGQKFRREGVWARTGELIVRKEPAGNKLAIYLEDRNHSVSIPIFAQAQAAETVTRPPWPVGKFLLDPNE